MQIPSRRHRGLLAVVTVAIASAVLAACSSNAAGNNTSQPSSGAGTPQHGGVFTIAIATDPTTLNYDITGSGSPDIANMQKLYDNGLLTENGQEEIEPSLAKSWTISPDALTYTFYLQHNVKWQDGVPFTSADVVFTIQKFLPYDGGSSGQIIPDMSKVYAVGPYEVVIQLKHRFDALLTALVDSALFMEPKHIYGNQNVVKDNAANDHPIGTGPFIFKSWIHGQKLTFVRNPHYWAATATDPIPWISEVVVAEIPSPATTVDAMLNGSIDYIPDSELPTTAIKQLQNSSCCRAVLVADTPSFNIIFMNLTRAPFNNLTVRHALYMAINRNTIYQDALSGYATPSLAPIPPTYAQLWDPKLNLMTQYPYDPSKAAAMLTAAGYPVKNGERFGRALTLLYSAQVTQGASQTAAIVKADFAQINVNVNLVNEDLNTWAQTTYTKRNFDMSFIGYTSGNDPSAGGITLSFECQPNLQILYTNPSGYCNKTVDNLFAQAATAKTTQERQTLYAQAQTIVDNDLPAFLVGWRTAYVGVSKRLQNYKAQLSGGGSFAADFAEAWLYPLNP